MKLGLISDIHEDIISLRRAIKLINNKQCDEIVCLGDIVGYSDTNYDFRNSRNASECLAVIKGDCSVVVKGNHDLFAIKKITNFRNGFDYPDNWFDLNIDSRMELAGDNIWLYEDEEQVNNLSENDKEYIDALPEYVVKNYGGINFLFSHYFYPDISGSEKKFRYKKKEIREHLEFIEQNSCMIGISGHVHADGFLTGTRNRYIWKDYGKHLLRKKLSCITCPCIASSSNRSNGFMIFDTVTFEVEVVKLGR